VPPPTPDAGPLTSPRLDSTRQNSANADSQQAALADADEDSLMKNTLITPVMTKRDVGIVCNAAELHASSQVVEPKQRLRQRAAPVTPAGNMTNAARAHQALRLTRRFLQPDDEMPMSIALAVAHGEFACGSEHGFRDFASLGHGSEGVLGGAVSAVPTHVLATLGLGEHGRTDSSMSNASTSSGRSESPHHLDGDAAAEREAMGQAIGAASLALITPLRAGPKLVRQRSRALALGFDSSSPSHGGENSDAAKHAASVSLGLTQRDRREAEGMQEIPHFGNLALDSLSMARGVSAPDIARRRGSMQNMPSGTHGNLTGHVDADDVRMQLPNFPPHAHRSKTDGNIPSQSAQNDLVDVLGQRGASDKAAGGHRRGPSAHDIDDFDPEYHARNKDDAESVSFACHVGNSVVNKVLGPDDFDVKYEPFQFVPYTHTRGRFLWFSAHARILVFPRGVVARELQRVDSEAKKHARAARR